MIDDDAKRMLDEYAYSVASNFPINRLHNDIFNEKKIAKDSNDAEFENVKKQLGIFLRAAETQEERYEMVNRLLTAEPFCDYSERIKTLLEEGSL